MLHLRAQTGQQALGMPLLPTKPLAQEQPPMTHRYLMALQGIVWQSSQIATVLENTEPLARPHHGKDPKAGTGTDAE